VATRPQTDALRGSLDLLVLKTLSLEPMHGWGISLRVQQVSRGVLEVNQGSLYPALQRLGDDRQQPAGPLLPADARRPAGVRRGAGELAPLRRRAGDRPPHHLTGRPWSRL